MDRESHNHNPYPAGWPLMDQLKMPTGTWQERKTLILYVQPFYWFICTVLSSVHVGGRFNLRFTLVAEVISPNNCCWTVAVVYLPGNTLAYARSLRLVFASRFTIASVSGHARYRLVFSFFREGLLCHTCGGRTLLTFLVGCFVDCNWFCWLVATCVVNLTQNLFISIVDGILPIAKPSAFVWVCWIQLLIMYLILSSSVPVLLATT